jgi:hypothetical protein
MQIPPIQPSSKTKLTLRRDGPRAWLLSNSMTSTDVGGVRYQHTPDGNHYRPWMFVDGAPQDVGEPVAQLAMAARTVASALALAAIQKK